MKVTRTERGWGAHLIVCSSCLFRRNTLLERGETRIVVSTVGAYRSSLPPIEGKFDTIGHRRYYETMAFHASKQGSYWDADICEHIEFESKWAVAHIEEHADLEANEMHEAVVAELTKRLEDGEEFTKKVEQK